MSASPTYFKKQGMAETWSAFGKDIMFTTSGVYLMGFLEDPRDAVMIPAQVAVDLAKTILEVYDK